MLTNINHDDACGEMNNYMVTRRQCEESMNIYIPPCLLAISAVPTYHKTHYYHRVEEDDVNTI